jgi:hypothetical protein
MYSPTIAPTCETISFLVNLLITMPSRDTVRRVDDTFQTFHTNVVTHNRKAKTTFHSRTLFSRKKSRNQTKSVNVSNISTPLHITNLNSIILLHKTSQIENISFKLLRLRSLYGSHNGHFKMAAEIEVGFIFCRYRNCIQVKYF